MSDGSGRPAGAAGPEEDPGAAPGPGEDELALRRLMRQAVSDIAPSDAALEQLRKAVPARRARKRQAAVGAIAAGVFVAMAVPAVLHVTNTNASNDRPSIAGNSEATHGGVDAGKASGGGSGKSKGEGPGRGKDKAGHGKKDRGGGKGRDTAGTSTDRPGSGSTAAASSPVCDASELGTPVSNVGVPDANGTVYGSFRVTNVSTGNCTIDGAGAVGATAQGAADPARVAVVDHTSGDAATGLPDPSTEPSQLILEPGMSYEVRFAWVPSGQCPATGGPSSGGSDGGSGDGGTESPSPTPTEQTTGAGDSTDSGLSTQLGSDDPAQGSVVVEHTAEPGAPSANATIQGACQGTVYKTGVLPAS
ncbi:hypothetical protein [Streptomyces xanthii]|uniref:hypothetical protein n=1 Tax=Streptomyces xanthii TaxID=2768069 RepID=UPI001CB791C6|nr:hypothetical protein [Streptomyces xanthii]